MRLRVITVALLFLFLNNAVAQEATQEAAQEAVDEAAVQQLVIPDDKVVIQFETKLGLVTFAHAKHAGLSITECITCHHKMEPGDTAVRACHECHQHKSDENAPKTKNAFHTRCTGCHEYTVAGGQHAGPVKKKCRLCHIKPAKK